MCLNIKQSETSYPAIRICKLSGLTSSEVQSLAKIKQHGWFLERHRIILWISDTSYIHVNVDHQYAFVQEATLCIGAALIVHRRFDWMCCYGCRGYPIRHMADNSEAPVQLCYRMYVARSCPQNYECKRDFAHKTKNLQFLARQIWRVFWRTGDANELREMENDLVFKDSFCWLEASWRRFDVHW